MPGCPTRYATMGGKTDVEENVVRTFDFGLGLSRHIEQYGSNFRISRLIHNDDIHVACMYLEAAGVVGYHPASGYQLFAVIQGEGWVRTCDAERTALRSGQAALWSPGEYHEAGTDAGMVAMVIEGDVLGGAPETIGPPL